MNGCETDLVWRYAFAWVCYLAVGISVPGPSARWDPAWLMVAGSFIGGASLLACRWFCHGCLVAVGADVGPFASRRGFPLIFRR